MNTDTAVYNLTNTIMKKRSTQTKDGTQTRNSGSRSLITAMLSMVLLCIVFVASCKKDNFQGEVVGLCPTVTTDPMDKAIDVALNKVITLTFNTNMAASTITNSSFTITPAGGSAIAGTIAPTTNSAVFTFTPTLPLQPNVVYTGTITTAATDTLRTALVANYVWTFTTIPQLSVNANPVAGGLATGSGTFAKGSTVAATATPNAGYVFVNWTDNGVAVSTSTNYQFTLSGNRALVANFVPVPPGNFALNLSSSPVSGGTTAGTASYTAGSTVTAAATPAAGYTFTNWTDNGVIVSTSPNYQFVLSANRTLVANFKIIPASQFAVILSSSPPDGGTTSGSGSYNAASSVTVTATPNPNYSFTNWTENGVVVSTSASYTFLLNANRTLVANFTIITYTLNVTATNGSVVANPNQATYNSGSNVQLTATANPGFVFTGWSGDASGTNNPLTVNMNSNKNITANFVPITFTLNVTAVNGTVVKNPNQANYNSGSTVQLTALANPGFSFTGWTGDVISVLNPLTVTMNSNKNITANFTAIAAPLFTSIFGAFGGSAGITNQGINTVINNGSMGTTAVSTAITGFHDGLTADVYTETPLNVGLVTGGIYSAPPFPGTATKFTAATQALAAANAFYISISPANRPGGTDPGAGELGNLTLAPGTYKSAGGSFKITNGNLTLDAQGNPNAVWVFQAPTSLTVGIAGPAGARSVILTNGAQAQNVYWYVGSAATINGAGGGIMTGTIIASAGVTFSTAGNVVQTVLNGKAISLVASVTMVNTTINVQ
jgi:uncharacterized repeat protein (TIGR02543 family)